jgi:hypothetical protein
VCGDTGTHAVKTEGRSRHHNDDGARWAGRREHSSSAWRGRRARLPSSAAHCHGRKAGRQVGEARASAGDERSGSAAPRNGYALAAKTVHGQERHTRTRVASTSNGSNGSNARRRM